MVVAGREDNFERGCLLGNALKSPAVYYRPVETETGESSTGKVYQGRPITWMRNLAYLTSNMTDQEKRDFERDRDRQYAEGQCKRCEGYRDYLLKYSMHRKCSIRIVSEMPSDLPPMDV